MRRVGLGVLALAAVFCVGCGGTSASTPTAPTTVTPAPAPAPAPAPSPAPTTGCAVPEAPTNVQATTVSNTATLTWTGVSNATQYVVLVGTTSGSSNTLLTNTSQTHYSWSGVKEGVYYARIEAQNSCGGGRASAEVTFTVQF